MDNSASYGNTATQEVIVYGGSFNNNGSDGIDLEQYPNDEGGIASQSLTVEAAEISGNGSDGMEMSNSATNGAEATQSIIVTDTFIRENSGYGFNVSENSQDLTSDATMLFDFTGATIAGNGIDDWLINLGGTQYISLPDGTTIDYP
jgi:hypothetical protein